MEIAIEKAPGGFRVDGLELKGGKCGCTSVLRCCFSWSKVKRSGNTFSFTAKATTPDTKENFTWGYTVKKGDYTIEVTFDDARDKTIYSGFYPPRIEQWKNALRFGPATFSMRKATPSALAASARSKSVSFDTAMWIT